MTLTLVEFLLLTSIQKGIARMRENAHLLSTKVKVNELEDKIFLTRHGVEGCVSSRGFLIEKVADNIFAVIPKSLILVKN